MNAAIWSLFATEPTMGGNQQNKDWGKILTNSLLIVGVGGGAPYVTTLQAELRQTREAVIRMEEQAKNRDEAWHRMELEQQRMREQIERLNEQLREKKVVNKVAADVSGMAGTDLVKGR